MMLSILALYNCSSKYHWNWQGVAPSIFWQEPSSNTWCEMQSSLIITGINNKGVLGTGWHGNTPSSDAGCESTTQMLDIYEASWLRAVIVKKILLSIVTKCKSSINSYDQIIFMDQINSRKSNPSQLKQLLSQ